MSVALGSQFKRDGWLRGLVFGLLWISAKLPSVFGTRTNAIAEGGGAAGYPKQPKEAGSRNYPKEAAGYHYRFEEPMPSMGSVLRVLGLWGLGARARLVE